MASQNPIKTSACPVQLLNWSCPIQHRQSQRFRLLKPSSSENVLDDAKSSSSMRAFVAGALLQLGKPASRDQDDKTSPSSIRSTSAGAVRQLGNPASRVQARKQTVTTITRSSSSSSLSSSGSLRRDSSASSSCGELRSAQKIWTAEGMAPRSAIDIVRDKRFRGGDCSGDSTPSTATSSRCASSPGSRRSFSSSSLTLLPANSHDLFESELKMMEGPVTPTSRSPSKQRLQFRICSALKERAAKKGQDLEE